MSEKPIPDWVKVGAECATYSYHQGYSEPRKIEKIYKTGRFVLEGSSQQYRPLTDKRAIATGDSFYSPEARLVTSEIEAAIALQKDIESFRADIKTVQTASSEAKDDSLRAALSPLLAQAAAIIKKHAAKNESAE